MPASSSPSPTAGERRTDRLLLRPWRHSEAARLLDVHRRPEVVRWFGTPTVMADLDQAHDLVERYAAYAPPLGAWAVERLADGRVVGTVLLLPVPGSDRVQVGWYLHPDSVGHGYATEAARAVLDHASEAGLTEVLAHTDVDNAPSHAVCHRLGMVEHARLEGERPTLVWRVGLTGRRPRT